MQRVGISLGRPNLAAGNSRLAILGAGPRNTIHLIKSSKQQRGGRKEIAGPACKKRYQETIDMKTLHLTLALVAVAATLAIPSDGQKDNQHGRGRAVITVLPAHSGDQVVDIAANDIKIKVNGKDSSATSITPLRGSDSPVELVLLIDTSARASLGEQFDEITKFAKEIPANAKVGIAYMQNGRAALAAPLSADSSQVVSGLRLPSGSPGSNGSPYFCLSDLAKHWPSNDRAARREVVMISDGVDNYQRQFDANDPYVEAAINDSVRSGLIVYSMYWRDRGRLNSTEYETNAGQSLLQMVTQATGGYSYWQGTGNPVSFGPYFDDLRRRLNHQYALSFATPFNGKPEVRTLKVDLDVPSAKVEAPQRAFVGAEATPSGE